MNKQDEECDDKPPEVEEQNEAREEETASDHEDYGRNKMENFKLHARNVLLAIEQDPKGISVQ